MMLMLFDDVPLARFFLSPEGRGSG